MYKQKTIAVVVPAYNEGELIGETLSSIPEYVDKIYAVDDGSPDETFQIIQGIAEKDSRVIPIKVIKNGWVGAAIVTGKGLVISTILFLPILVKVLGERRTYWGTLE